MSDLLSVAIGFASLLAAGTSAALEGTFDRGAEVNAYIKLATEGTRGDLVLKSKDLYVSGISDPRLAAALSERLLKDYKTLSKTNRADIQYGAWLVKGLASQGLEESAVTLKKVKLGAKSGQLKAECDDEIDRLAWHKRKNEIMSSRQFHVEGENPRIAQLHNLLVADDFSYKHMAADRISWEKIRSPRLYDAMADQLVKYMDSTGISSGRQQDKAMGMYAKLLGYSNDKKYRATLEQVMSSSAGYLLKSHAKDALERLQ
jgi:hypothetical protein